MYIPVKGNKSTYFIQCDPTQTALNIKQKVENDAVVALALRKDDNEFKEVFIARLEDFMSSS